MDSQEAFEALLSDLVSALSEARRLHEEAIQQDDLTAMVNQHERAMSLITAREQLESLRHSWSRVVGQGQPKRTRGPVYQDRRAVRGAKTPTEAFYLPLLRALEELGGEAAVSEVEERVGELMAAVLNEVDRARLRHAGVRWHSTLRSARQEMKQKGFLAAGSPHGIWEITEKGRDHLQEEEESH